MNAMTPLRHYEPIGGAPHYDASAVRAYTAIDIAATDSFVPTDGFSAKANILDILKGTKGAESQDMLEAAMAALTRIDQRQGEDIDAWVTEISKSFIASAE